MTHERTHKTAAELLSLAAAGGLAEDPHLLNCALCREMASLINELSSAPAPRDRSTLGPCPLPSQIEEVAAGITIGEPALDLLQHAGDCSRCGKSLRTLLDVFSPGAAEPLPVWNSSSRQRLAKRLAAESKAPHPIRPPRRRPLYWAAAAAVAAGACFAFFYLRQSSVDNLLAKAYTERRPFDFRMDDTGHSPIQQKLSPGSTFGKAPSLLRAEADLAGRAEDPSTLLAKGRAELLGRDFESAILTLERAVALNAPGAQRDLAAAYSLRGDTVNRPEDHGKALDLILSYLRGHPRDERALFNHALILERMQLFEDALAAWDRFLDATKESAWREEALEHRDLCIQKKTSAKPR